MTRDEIIRMAHLAGFQIVLTHEGDLPAVWSCTSTPDLERFAALVAAAEREECAQLCELKSASMYFDRPQTPMDCANAIRARGQK